MNLSDLITDTNNYNNSTNMDISTSMENISSTDATAAVAVVPATTPPLNSSDNNNIEGGGGGGDDDQSRAEATFRFTVNDFSKFKDSKESKLSTPCIVRNLPWKILALNKQANNREETKSLGFFLQCNADSESTRWSVAAVAELRLLHQTDAEKNFVKKIQHVFFVKENDWGYSPFLTLKEILDPEKGFYNAKDDSITLEVWLNADAPHGTAWDSKKLTGFVGLTNQGATCYMNSLLQTLFFTNKLRQAVYLITTDNDDPIKSVPFALQRVFYDLQFSEKSVGTKKLTRSFGWETLDTFMQHDVQELCRVLLDNIENKMKHTNVDGIIPKLFEGKMISYVKCKEIDYESRRVEGFYDIQLNIKGKKDILESFKEYITVETLDGENKYDAGKYGLQEAQKGVFFEKFPPVLHLHLMRFQYDPQTDSNIKINDKFEFFEKIELDDFLEKEESTPATYLLHAVLVHSGDNHGGHYVVFINPKLDGNWFKFDDEVVSRCTRKDAVMNNFGGNSSDDITFRHSSNAYMLVYVRDSCKDEILHEVDKDDIPANLHDRLSEERRVELIKKKERSEAPNFMQLNLFLEEEFLKHSGAELYDVYKVEATKQVKIRKMDTVLRVKQSLCESFNCAIESLRMWSIVLRNNNTNRPGGCIDIEENLNKNISELSRQDNSLSVYIEIGEFNSQTETFEPLPVYNPKEDVLLFFKYYDQRTSILKYACHLCFPTSTTLRDVEECLNIKMKFPPKTELLFFEEIRMSEIKPMLNKDHTLEQLGETQLLDGDIYVFQINDKEKLQQYKLPTVIDYFKDLASKCDVLFIDKNQANDEGFTLTLSLKMRYDELTKAVAAHLNWDHLKLQLFRSTSCYDLKSSVAQPIKYAPEFTLNEAFLGVKASYRRLFYQKLNIKLTELDDRRQFKCTWISSNLKCEKELILLPFKKALVRDLLEECKNLLLHNQTSTINSLTTNSSSSSSPEQQQEESSSPPSSNNNSIIPISKDSKLRLIEVVGFKVNRVLKEDMCIDALENQLSTKSYRIEQVLDDELKICQNELLLPIAHFTKEIYATYGIPFLMKVRQGEPYKDIKQRIQKRLEVGDKEFLTYRFALITMGNANYVAEDDETQQQLFELTTPSVQPWLGIDHANKASRNKSRYTNLEKAIKIFN